MRALIPGCGCDTASIQPGGQLPGCAGFEIEICRPRLLRGNRHGDCDRQDGYQPAKPSHAFRISKKRRKQEDRSADAG